jgi:hypothetical protein
MPRIEPHPQARARAECASFNASRDPQSPHFNPKGGPLHMKRIGIFRLAWSAVLMVVCTSVSFATPSPNGASVETRTFNDCPLSTLTVTNNYPNSIEITDEMAMACVGFANLHSFSFSTDGGLTAAAFNNNSNFTFGADLTISGAGEGEGGLRVSPWYGKFVDGRFMANVTTGEIACFGGALPFYSFTGNHAITYVRGTTIRFEITYKANDLFTTHPASIQYRVIYGGNTYESGELPFGIQNTAECDPNGLFGCLNDGRAGGYFQPRANTGAALTANWSNIAFSVLAADGTPIPNAASLELRTFNDCPLSVLTTNNSYPAMVSINDVMDPACVGFANLHSWSFSDDGGATAAAYHNNSNYRFSADFKIDGAGEGEGGLRISPWYGKFVDGRFMANATSGEIACFGGALPFYSFTGAHGVTYVKGTTVRLDVTYRSNDNVESDPATIQYQLTQGGITYDSGELPFGKQNAAECNPNGLWGMLNDGRVGGYYQPRANTGASLTAMWSNIRETNCTDPADVHVSFHPRKLNLNSKSRSITVCLTPAAPYSAADIDPESITLNGVPASGARLVGGDDHDDDDDDGGDDLYGDDDDGDDDDDGGGHRPAKLKVRFDRKAVAATVTAGERVPMLVSGSIGEAGCFATTTHIRVRKPRIRPHDHDLLAAGAAVELNWLATEAAGAFSLSLLSSTDDGETWRVEDASVPNTGRYTWTVPNTPGSMRLALARVSHMDESGVITDIEAGESGTFFINSTLAVGDEALSFALRGISPNPTKGDFTISFSLPDAEPATVEVYDVSGRQILARNVGSLGAGTHQMQLGRGQVMRPGVYMVRLNRSGQTLSGRAIVIP